MSESLIFCLGVNHETAPLEMRERLAYDGQTLGRMDSKLQVEMHVDEWLMLSTCNRTEVYFTSTNYQEVLDWFVSESKIPSSSILPHIYVHTGVEALRHSARVASGLNSMILGETQIHGQMKAAFQEARQQGSLKSRLGKFFEITFHITKIIRSETEIGARSISLASAALKSAYHIFGDLRDCSVLFIGAGEMIRLCAEHFSKSNFSNRIFANRSPEKAAALANRFSGNGIHLSDVENTLSSCDVIVSCTSSPLPLIGKGMVENALSRRRHRPIVIFDLAVPRDVEAGVAALDDVFLFSIDDLGDIVKAGETNRQAAVAEADKIIDKSVKEYSGALNSNQVAPAVRVFRDYGDALVNEELLRALQSMKNGKSPEDAVRHLAHSLGNKFLDRPCRAVSRAADGRRQDLIASLMTLFQLDDTR
jgi:glutamyl-tRNA reductase